MVNDFLLGPTPEIIFGAGKRKLLPVLTKKYGENVLVITGSGSFRNSVFGKSLLEDLSCTVKNLYLETISGEPTPEMIDDIVQGCNTNIINLVVAVGGGSVIDGGKAVSAMLGKSGTIIDFLEGIGTKQPDGNKIPFIAIPTTAGTGSEATKNAVITRIGEFGFKKSLRHDRYVPDIALVDPELNLSCPRTITGASGLDAVTQLLESFISGKSAEFTDALAIQGLNHAFGSLKTAWSDGSNLEARSDMSYAALLSGITLANVGLGTVHGFASAIGGLFPISHGVICGTLLNPCIKAILDHPDMPGTTFQKFIQIGKLMTKEKAKKDSYYIQLLTETLETWVELFEIPKLSALGVQKADFTKIVEQTENKNNPVKFTKMQLFEILESRY